MSIDYTVDGAVATIRLNRPEARNAIDPTMAAGIEAALDQFESDDAVRAGVICAEGSVFCAGADLKTVADGRADEFHTERGGFAGFVERPRTKPIVAAVEGPALAGGFEIALACDLIVAGPGARFGLPEVTVSIVAAAGGLFRTVRRLPQGIAMELALTGDPIGAERAYALGLINHLVEEGAARTEASAIAERIAANAPLAVATSREAVVNAWNLDEPEAFDDGRERMRRIAETEDFHEGVAAFVEKRPPRWTGR